MELADVKIGACLWLRYDRRTTLKATVLVAVNTVRPGMVKVRIQFGQRSGRSTMKWVSPADLMLEIPPAEQLDDDILGDTAYTPRAADDPPSSLSYRDTHAAYFGRGR